MGQIRIECTLPVSLLLLADGQYGALRWQSKEQISSAFFDVGEGSPPDFEALQIKQARSLVQRANRLIRWYRMVTADSYATECTLWKASPFRFFVETSNQKWMNVLEVAPSSPLLYGQPMVTGGVQQLSIVIREKFAMGTEPPVSQLFLFDARQALDEGRFREAVLFSWSTIDASFSKQFDAIADKKLADEWPEAVEFLKGIDFGLRHRMTIGLRLVAGRSLFLEPGDFWKRLSESYKRRNAIIHRGDVANEADAENAIRVAENVVSLMDKIMASQIASE